MADGPGQHAAADERADSAPEGDRSVENLESERAATVAGFLADGKTPCPACGYDLRGATNGTCPECGGALTLTLVHPNPLFGRRALLVLFFAWLVFAGGANTARTGIVAYEVAEARWASAQRPGSGGGVWWAGLGPVREGPLAGFTTGPWAYARGEDLAQTAGWAALATMAIACLGMVIWYAQRPAPKTVAAGLTRAAWVGFGAYFAVHGVLFVQFLLTR